VSVFMSPARQPPPPWKLHVRVDCSSKDHLLVGMWSGAEKELIRGPRPDRPGRVHDVGDAIAG